MGTSSRRSRRLRQDRSGKEDPATSAVRHTLAMTENCGAAPRQNTIQPLESKAGEPPVVFDKQILKARNIALEGLMRRDFSDRVTSA